MIAFSRKAIAEETVGDHVKEAVYDTLSAAALTFAAAESTVTGNLIAGGILCTLATREIFSAYYEAQAAWNLYRDNDGISYEPTYEPNQVDFFDRQE